MAKRILFLDDVRDPEKTLGALYCRTNIVIVCRTADEAVRTVTEQPVFDVWHLDHDLDMEILDANGVIVTAGYAEPKAPNGMDFLKWAAESARDKWPKGQVFVHSANPPGKANMESYIRTFERLVLGGGLSMWGPPKDVEGECNAHLCLGDDYGDSQATVRCQLPLGHEGGHQERGFVGEGNVDRAHNVDIRWAGCDRAWEDSLDAYVDAEDDDDV